MAKADQDDKSEAGGKSSSKKWILIGVGGAVLIAIVVGATLYMTGFFDGDAPAEEAAAQEKDVPPAPAIYQALEPRFLVNYQNSSGGVRVMQVEMSLMARDQAVIDAVNQHAPVIRNNLLLLLSGQDPEVLKTTEGKTALQQLVLDEVNKILAEQGVTQSVESVFFTSLVMQ